MNNAVHVIDDDDSAREALAFMLESADYRVRTYASAPLFLEALASAEPGCVVSDVRMPDMTGLELVQRLKALGCDFPVIIVTGHGDIAMAVEAMRAGVIDFLEKPFSEQRLLDALDRASRDAPPSAVEISESRSDIQARIESLSERERQVLDGVIAGQPNKMIARDLGISPRTVEIYRAKLMTKMQADNLASLVRMTLAVELAAPTRSV